MLHFVLLMTDTTGFEIYIYWIATCRLSRLLEAGLDKMKE